MSWKTGKTVAATCGTMYVPKIGKLSSYPIPTLRLPPGNGRVFVELGCGWGRWCIAAARAGYVPIGIDPMLGAVRAARRVPIEEVMCLFPHADEPLAGRVDGVAHAGCHANAVQLRQLLLGLGSLYGR